MLSCPQLCDDFSLFFLGHFISTILLFYIRIKRSCMGALSEIDHIIWLACMCYDYFRDKYRTPLTMFFYRNSDTQCYK